MKKYYIWGFPGIGKSSVNFKPRIIDADCERFKFVIPEDIPYDPHSQKNTAYTQRDPSYPNNYLDYIHSVDADIVLLNCHISLLKTLDRKRLLLDGIILGHFQGDYSSITTGTENNTVRAMVALKGFCLDCVHRLPSRPLTEFVIGYLKDHGTDISTPEKLNAWIRANPDKCALPENRGRVASHSEAGRTALEKGENTGKRRQKKHHDRGGR